MVELSEREAEILERVESAGYRVIRMEKRKNVERKLDDDEKLNLAAKMAGHAMKADEAEQKKKTIDGELKKVIDDNYAIVLSLGKALTDGFELIEDSCVIAIDPVNKVRLVFAVHNGKQIAREVVSDDDMKALQIKMPVEGAADPVQEAALKAAGNTGSETKSAKSVHSGAIEIGFDGGGEGLGAIVVEGEVVSGKDANAMVNSNEQTVVTQISLTEVSSGAFFATTARDAANGKQPFVLVAERPEDMELLKQAEQSGEYVKLVFEDIGERNKLLIKAEKVEMPKSQGIQAEDIPEGVEIGDDPDEGAESDNENPDNGFEDAGDPLGAEED